MTPLTNLKDALYQVFFSGKGSLALDLINLGNSKGEAWEFYEKKGKLYLKGDNDKALIYALSFLSRFPPKEALCYLGKWNLTYPIRALLIKNEPELDQAAIEQILKMGFNTVVGQYKELYGLNTLSYYVSKAKQESHRDKTLLDRTLEEVKAATADLFFTDEPATFLEIDFVPGKRILSFSSETLWDKLMIEPSFGTPLLPKITPSQDLRKLVYTLDRMSRHPFLGFVVEVEALPEPGSEEEKSLMNLTFGIGCRLVA